jgi:type IV pilus assembly protein PilW
VGNPAVPVYNTYAIANNALTVTSPFVVSGGVPVVNTIADNIVQMRVAYGLDDGVNNGSVSIGAGYTACDGIVDRFVDAATFNAIAALPACATALQTKWQLLIAMRVAVVARSALAEKPTGINGTNCDATTDGTEGVSVPDQRPTWTGGIIDVSASGDPNAASLLNWKCYRYKVFETTIPLRNWIWRSS